MEEQEKQGKKQKERSLLVRVSAVACGLPLGFLGILVSLVAPEIGVPMVLVALRLLGFQFAWARRANKWLDRKFEALKARFGKKALYWTIAFFALLLAFLFWFFAVSL